ncbi:MAG: hypothetical protein KF884_06885 [Fimbriimonadaceae bacterium]|nr:hypothetical protein [Fimbriimonadaceae bacterium]QYK57274.1 MAG: hypothetical protein KF884_06885 [Fimbriimonadaceae bacterium]
MRPFSRPDEAEARLQRIQRIRQRPITKAIEGWVRESIDPDKALEALEFCLRRSADPVATLDHWESAAGLGLTLARIGAHRGPDALARILTGQGVSDEERQAARLIRDAQGILAGLSTSDPSLVRPSTSEDAWVLALESGISEIGLASDLERQRISTFGVETIAIGSLARGEWVPGEPPSMVATMAIEEPGKRPWYTVSLPPESSRGRTALTNDPSVEAPWAGSDWWALVWACHQTLHGDWTVPRPGWSPGLLSRLVQIKSLIEAELSPTQVERRRVNLDDVSWAVDLAVLAGHIEREPIDTPSRINSLGRSGLLSPIEAEAMIDAHRFLLECRLRLGCLGMSPESVPENPDKLSRVARSFGMSDGNAFLGLFEGFQAVARRLFAHVAERLGP